jgi:hypothetical protein
MCISRWRIALRPSWKIPCNEPAVTRSYAGRLATRISPLFGFSLPAKAGLQRSVLNSRDVLTLGISVLFCFQALEARFLWLRVTLACNRVGHVGTGRAMSMHSPLIGAISGVQPWGTSVDTDAPSKHNR